jgi:hypothetical protein
MFYGGCVKMCENFTLNFGNKSTGCCITTTLCLTLPFPTGIFFTENNMAVVPPPTLLFSVSPIEVKTERQPF